jgi:glycosyltransferase involved in cell wall biosynthesis/RimJ/RimL family protein N-acetyltransferase
MKSLSLKTPHEQTHYQKSVLDTFKYMKSAASYTEALNRSIPFLDQFGYLIPVCELHANDTELIEKLTLWRAENSFAYPTQFKVTFEGTKTWLRNNVLNIEDRLLFLVLDQHGHPVGHLGYANTNNETADMEIDNVLRGDKKVQPGLMSMAMKTIIHWAEETFHPRRIFLRVLDDNIHAIDFYQRLNFQEDHRQPLRRVQDGDTVRYLPMETTNAEKPDKHYLYMTYESESLTAKNNELITLVIPARNEEENIPYLEKAVTEATALLPYNFEFIVVDNRSTDRTGELIKELCRRDPRWKYIRFSRDFSVEASIAAGYHFARGSAIILLYSDLQDPPSVIPRFLEKWKEGYEVVYGVRTVREGDPAWRNFMAKLAYRIIAIMAEVQIPVDTGDFRLIDRKVRDALENVGEYNRYMRGLIAWLGFKQTGIIYERSPRQAGVSKGPFWYIFFIAVNAITSFSMKPLRLFLLMGSIITVLSFIAILIYLLVYLFGNTVAGLITLVLLSFLAIGLNSIGIGILGEYIGRIYFETKKRPIYVVDEMIGFNNPLSPLPI